MSLIKKDSRLLATFSSTYHVWLLYERSECYPTLFETLINKLPHIPKEEIPERVAWGGTFINGREVNSDMPLELPCKLEYYEPRFPIKEAASFFPSFSKDYIIYEDAQILALFKPAGLPSLPGKEQKYYNLKSYVEQYLGSSIHDKLTNKPHMPSRLDMSTCGIVLISKDIQMHNRLQRLYETKRISKCYILATDVTPAWSTFLHTGMIGKDPEHPVLRRVVTNGGKHAETLFSVLPRSESESKIELIKAEPRTGRTHQIRVHASDLGIPILGDNFYGGAPAKGLHLMAFSLTFIHPQTNEKMHLEVPERLLPRWAKGKSFP